MASLSVPEFFKNFDRDAGVLTNPDLVARLEQPLSPLQPAWMTAQQERSK